MANLATAIRTATRALSLRVYVGGVLFMPSEELQETTPGVVSVNVSKSFDAPIPIATIGLTSIPTWVKQGAPVEIEMGYQGIRKLVFSGTVRSVQKATVGAELECVGRSANLGRVNDLSERAVDAQTVKTAIEILLGYCFILNKNTSTLAPYTFVLGSASDAILPRGSIMSMLQMLFDVEGLAIREDGNGTVHVEPFTGLPALNAFKTFTTDTLATAFIIDGRLREDPDYLRTRILLTGATITIGTPPDDVTSTIEATATLVVQEIVQPPLPAGSYIDMEFSNHLLDTQAKANDVAIRELGKYARVPQQLPLDIPGDPEIELGQTLGIYDEYLGVGAAGVPAKWFVHGVTHSITIDDGYRTEVDLRGGDRFGGTIGLNPVASFTYSVEREIFGTKEYIFLHLDGSASYDPDSEGPLIYLWSANAALDAADTPAIDSQTAAVPPIIQIDPVLLGADPQITLTVTDPDGLTGTLTLDVDLDAGGTGVTFPAVFAALGNQFSATPNGGNNWNDQSGNLNVDRVAAMVPNPYFAGMAVYRGGTGSDKIYRTTDYCATALVQCKIGNSLLGVGSPIVDIKWDWRNAARVWAVTEDLRLYVSTDYGFSFAQITEFQSIVSGGGSPPPAPFQATVVTSAEGPAVWALDLNTNTWTKIFDANNGQDTWKLRYTVDQSDKHWTFISGINVFGHGDECDFWHSYDGIAWTITWTHIPNGGQNAGAIDYDIAPDGTIWLLTGSTGTQTDRQTLTPLRVYKSIDGGVSWTLKYTDAGWTGSGFTNASTRPNLIAVNQQTGQDIVICCGGIVNVEPDSIYSTDGGETWQRRINPAQDFPRGLGSLDDLHFVANGRLMFLRSQTTCEVYYSNDLGATWQISLTNFNSNVGRALGHWRPSWGDKNVMICDQSPAGLVKVFLTTDNGVTWFKVDSADPSFAFTCWSVDYDPVQDVLVVVGSGGGKSGKITSPFTNPGRIALVDCAADFSANPRAVAFASVVGPTPPPPPVAGAAFGRCLHLPEDGSVWVGGGTGSGRPLLVYFTAGGETDGIASVYGGELATDLPAANALCAVTRICDKGDGGGMVIGLENYTAWNTGVRPLYHCISPFSPLGWKRATGLDFTVTTALKYAVPDGPVGMFHAAFGDRNVWHSIDGVAWTKTADVLEVGFTPNQCLWMREDANGLRTAGTYLIAAEDSGGTGRIYKSRDGMLSPAGIFRHVAGFGSGWPSGAKAKDLALGQSGTAGPEDNLIAIDAVGSPNQFTTLIGSTWQPVLGVTGNIANDPGIIPLSRGLFWAIGSGDRGSSACESTPSTSWGLGQFSRDQGATWAPVPDPGINNGGIYHMAYGAGGRLWCIVHDSLSESSPETYTRSRIFYSDNHGVSWSTAVFTDGTGVSSQQSRFWKIIPHRTNPNLIAAIGFTPNIPNVGARGAIAYTANGGVTWTVNRHADIKSGQVGVMQLYDAVMLDSGRIVVLGWFELTKTVIRHSDDFGITWGQARIFDDGLLDRVYGLYYNTSRTTLAVLRATAVGGSGMMDSELIMSYNSGTTWAGIPLTQEFHDFMGGSGNSVLTNCGMVFNQTKESFYLQHGGVLGSNRKVIRLQPVGPSGIWTDLTLNYPWDITAPRDGLGVVPS